MSVTTKEKTMAARASRKQLCARVLTRLILTSAQIEPRLIRQSYALRPFFANYANVVRENYASNPNEAAVRMTMPSRKR